MNYIMESLSEEPEEERGLIAMKAALGGRISKTGLKCEKCGAWICEACRMDSHEGCGGAFRSP
jgi:hypothetical protein